MKTQVLPGLWTKIGILILCAGILWACQPQVVPTSPEIVIATSVAATMQAKSAMDMLETLTAEQTLQSLPTSTPTTAPTNTPLPSPTISVQPTQAAPTTVYIAPQPTATNTPQKLCLQAILVSDVTIPAGTEIKSEETFTKTWKFQNTGICAWTTEFDIFFIDGDQMSAPAVLDFPAAVQPGGTIEISIPMKAPKETGTYTGYWIFADQGGNRFGTGSDGKSSFSVSIKVK